jgi:hypothetical protein
MILLYTLLLLLLGLIKLFVSLRARALERKYTGVAVTVDRLVRETDFKFGNANRTDPCSSAKRTFRLGQLVEQRDRLEGKYVAWARWLERLNRWVNAARNWKGKKLPYTLGALDVWLLLYLIDNLGAGRYVSARSAIEFLASLFSK